MKKSVTFATLFALACFAYGQTTDSTSADLEAQVAKLRTDLTKLEKIVEQKNKRLDPLLEATVQTSFGVDFNTMATGFNNLLTSAFTLSVIDSASKDSIARGDIVGYIRVSNFKLNLTQNEVVGSKGSVEAYLRANPFSIKLWGKPSFAANAATAFDAADAADDVRGTIANPMLMGITLGYSSKGIKDAAGADISPQLAIQIASAGDLTKNVSNEYYLGFTSELDLIPSLLKLRTGATEDVTAGGIKFNQDPIPMGTSPAYFGSYSFYVNPQLSVAVLKGLSFGAAMDGGQVFDSAPGIYKLKDFAWDANASAVLKLSDKAIRNFTDVWSNLTLSAYYRPPVVVGNPANLDASLSFYEIDENDGLLPGIGLGLNVLALNLLTPAPQYAGYGNLSWKIAVAKPYVSAGWNVDKDNKYDGLKELRLKAGTELFVIPRATIVAEYGSTDLLTAVDGDKGYFTLGVKVSY